MRHYEISNKFCNNNIFSFSGYLKDQKEFEESLRKSNMTMAATLYGPGQDRQDRFHLNDMSFAGPVIMGIGGNYYDLIRKFI